MDEEAIFDYVERPEVKISRKRGTYTFRVLGDSKLKQREGLKMMNMVDSEDIDWLWRPYVPFGRLTMLSGDPGAGKSFITVAIASALSRGDPLPGEGVAGRDPMITLMIAAEDDPADTLKPRLVNLRADQTKIAVFGEDIVFDQDGLTAIDQMIQETGARLVIIDPIVAFLGPKVDMSKANEVRHIMKGLGKIARKRKVAVILVRHNRKGLPGDKAIYAGAGSIDFTASVRSELAVTTANNGVRFLNHIKANSGKTGPSLYYSIEEQSDGSGLFRWGGVAQTTTRSSEGKIVRKPRNGNAVQQWLFDMLKNYPDGVRAPDVIAAGKEKGFTETQIKMVKHGTAVSEKRGSDWYWRLDSGAPIASDPAKE